MAIERAIELDDPPHAARRARLLALQAQELAWDPDFDRRHTLADEAIALARSAGDARTLVEVLCQVSYALWSAETLELRRGLARELSDRVASVRDPALQFSAHYIEHSICIEGAELTRAETVLEHMQLIAEQSGQPTLRWFATFPAAGYELMRGDLVTAERLAERAFQLGQEAGEPDAALVYGGQLSYALATRGRGEEIVATLEASVSAYPGIAAWRAALAWTLCWLDRHAEAEQILEHAARDRFQHIQAGPARLTALSLYADAAAQMCDFGAASVLYDLIEPCADQVVWNTVTGGGHVRMWLGLLAAVLGRQQSADEHLDFACEFQEENGLLLWATRAYLGWAEALTARGDRPHACECATRALELSRQHGYGAFETRALALLDARPVAEA